MPLPENEAQKITDYCWKDIPDLNWHKGVFNFIDDVALREKLAFEYRSARYIYKLGEALRAKGEDLYGHAKYQVMQYASIYEAVVGYLLWVKYPDHKEVKEIQNTVKLSVVHNLPVGAKWRNEDSELDVFLCVKSESKLNPMEIKFERKVDAIVRIGLIEDLLGKDIKKVYKDRNGMHIENAIKNKIDYDLLIAKMAYRRIYPFTRQIKSFIDQGLITEDLKLKNMKDSNIPKEAKI